MMTMLDPNDPEPCDAWSNVAEEASRMLIKFDPNDPEALSKMLREEQPDAANDSITAGDRIWLVASAEGATH